MKVEFTGDAAKALGAIATELEKLGYRPESQEADGLKMRFAGKWITTDPDKVRHSVTVAPAGDYLSFKFGTGLIASMWTPSDVAWAQARADEVVAAAHDSL